VVVTIYQTRSNVPTVGINHAGIVPNHCLDVFSHISNPFSLDSHGLMIKDFAGIYTDEFTIPYNQVGRFVAHRNIDQAFNFCHVRPSVHL
jgi:hypothetical protein